MPSACASSPASPAAVLNRAAVRNHRRLTRTARIYRLIGRGLALGQRLRILWHPLGQRWLRFRYRLKDRPVAGFDEGVQRSIDAWAEGRTGAFAESSGTTARPKRVFYTPARARMVRRIFIVQYLCWAARWRLRWPSIYMFGTMSADRSLSALLSAPEDETPSWALLGSPHRAHKRPLLRALEFEYGRDAVRCLVLALSDPGVWYATNPSTLTAFLDRIDLAPESVRALVRAFQAGEFGDEVYAAAAALVLPGWSQRLSGFLTDAPSTALFAAKPKLRYVVTWDGGYVAPFLENLRPRLPSEVRFVPMYALSTEVVATVPYYPGPDRVRFVPVAPGVCYEFARATDDAPPGADLVPASALRVNEAYRMVVSDPWGLRRYDTGDIFRCVGKLGALPDLRFLRRGGLSYSFTGEKLTGGQVAAALDEARSRMGATGPARLRLALAPEVRGADYPGYCLLIMSGGREDVRAAAWARAVDEALCGQNQEYAAKRSSGRLGAVRPVTTSEDEVVRVLGAAEGVEDAAQFKFLPLFPRCWGAQAVSVSAEEGDDGDDGGDDGNDMVERE